MNVENLWTKSQEKTDTFCTLTIIGLGGLLDTHCDSPFNFSRTLHRFELCKPYSNLMHYVSHKKSLMHYFS
jgi:hypothetical protein